MSPDHPRSLEGSFWFLTAIIGVFAITCIGKGDEGVAAGDLVMIRRENKNDQAQFGLILELTNQNKDAVVKLQSGYCMATATGNLIPVASGQSDGREQQVNMNCVGKKFFHFISASTKTNWEKCQALGRGKIPRKCTLLLGASMSQKTKWRRLR